MSLLVVTLASGAGEPATKPAIGDMRTWVADLADADPSVREKARDQLMGLEREDLPRLREVIERAGTLAPSQLTVIKGIVLHVYLSGDKYERDGSGFLGIEMATASGGDLEMQVVVSNRMPGFCSYRMLQNGDVILGIVEQKLPEPLQPEAFREAVRGIGAGKTIHLKLLRRGKLVEVAIKLDGRPAQTDVLSVDQLLRRRNQEAEEYWKANFASLLDKARES